MKLAKMKKLVWHSFPDQLHSEWNSRTTVPCCGKPVMLIMVSATQGLTTSQPTCTNQ